MKSVKLFFIDAVIENLVNLLGVEFTPTFIDVYMDMLERLMHARRALRAR